MTLPISRAPRIFVITQDNTTLRFDGTLPVTFTPARDGTVTVAQGDTHSILPNSRSFTGGYKGSWPAPVNQTPVANFTFTTSGLTANFTDTSTDSDGTISSRSWTFGDGGTSTATNPSHTYAASGTYTVTLTVTDNGGAQNSKSAALQVQEVVTPPTGDIDLSYIDMTSPAYASFKSWVDRNVPRNDGYNFTATDCAYMYKLTGESQYATKAISLMDAYATKVEAAISAGGQPNWGGDANGSDGISSDSYLSVGSHLRDFALTIKWCNPPDSLKTRLIAIMTQAVFNVWNPAQAKWGGRSFPWSGWSAVPPDPGDNYFYSFTLATDMYRWVTVDAQYANRTWPVASAYFATIPTGGSEEGTGYGTSHKGLFEDVRFHRNIFGDDYADAHLTNSIYYWIHATTPDYARFAAIGDQSRVSNPTLWDYQWVLVAQAQVDTPDNTAKGQAAWWLQKVDPSGNMTNSINYRDGLLLNNDTAPLAPTALSYFGQSTGDLFVRTGWDTGAIWAAFRAGKFNQSHAHQDQGAFQIYSGGNWLSVDQSVWSRSGIQQDVANNSTLRFLHSNGQVVRQVYNSASTMTVTGNDPAQGVHAVANLQPAVGAAASAWTRAFDFVGNVITITDTFTVTAGYTAISQLQVPVQPTINGNVITAGRLKATVVSPTNATITTTAMTSMDSDYSSGYRIDIAGGASGYIMKLEVV